MERFEHKFLSSLHQLFQVFGTHQMRLWHVSIQDLAFRNLDSELVIPIG